MGNLGKQFNNPIFNEFSFDNARCIDMETGEEIKLIKNVGEINLITGEVKPPKGDLLEFSAKIKVSYANREFID